jgi:hypothetical protein
VIVYQHNHVFGNYSFATIFTEGMQERLAPNDWLKKWTHAEVDAGADIVVMHGAPLLHGVELYHGKLSSAKIQSVYATSASRR